MNNPGLTKKQQKQICANIFKKGMTITGWARVNEFSPKTVQAVLYGDYGRQEKLTFTCCVIIAKLVEDGFYTD